MKVGDLVQCTWQPRATQDGIGDGIYNMKHHIKGELGIIVKQWSHYHRISFPQFGYEHDLSKNAFKVINEVR